MIDRDLDKTDQKRKLTYFVPAYPRIKYKKKKKIFFDYFLIIF